MSTSDAAFLPADEMQVFRDSALVLSVRRQWDQLLLDALAAPGLGVAQARRVATFVTGGRLNEGEEALSRIASWTQED